MKGWRDKVARASAEQTMLLDLSLAPGGLTPELVKLLKVLGPYGVGWPGPRVAVGPVHIVKADIVGNDHLRVIAAGQDGRSLKAIAFRAASSEMGQSILHGRQGPKVVAGRSCKDRRLGCAPRCRAPP
jgi:single-stranded-DNA-specific exonuclease